MDLKPPKYATSPVKPVQEELKTRNFDHGEDRDPISTFKTSPSKLNLDNLVQESERFENDEDDQLPDFHGNQQMKLRKARSSRCLNEKMIEQNNFSDVLASKENRD